MVGLKTIKQEKQVRLDELISYIWKNEITSTVFESYKGKKIFVGLTGSIHHEPEDYFTKDDLFIIEEEAEITADTKLDITYRVKNQHVWRTFDEYGTTINEIIKKHENLPNLHLYFIHLLNEDGSIGDLIWSKERGLID